MTAATDTLSAPPTESPEAPTNDLGGKYLTFLLANDEYGIEIIKVREIIGVLDITRVPQSQEFVRGVINLRGKVIPVVDLRLKFGLPFTEYNDQTCVIVVDVGMLMGIIVDTVREVDDIPAADIDPPTAVGRATDTSFILGVGKVDGHVKLLLNIDEVLTSAELVIPTE